MNPNPRLLFVRAADQAAALFELVRVDELEGPTPCTEFDVRTLLSHIVGVTIRLAVAAEGADANAVQPFVDDVPDDGWAAAYDTARARAIQAWAQDGSLEAVMRMPFGEMPGHAVLMAFVMETVAHTWDLSEALGHPGELDPDLAACALTVAHQMLPDEQRTGGMFGSAHAVPESAGPYEKLAAWLGRERLIRA
ncbi:TIGR03086 family metal-binding protein [Nocardia sp. R16R-3T]